MSHVAALQSAFPWLQTPIIANGPMSMNIAGGELAAAVTLAGGMGHIGFNDNQTLITRHLETAKSKLTDLMSTTGTDVLPIGLGILIFAAQMASWLPMIAMYKPAVVWLSFGTSDEFATWAAGIRQTSPNTQVWVQVGTVSTAVEAALACKPNAIVLQGIDAGGHGHEFGASIVSLVPEAADALASQNLSEIAIVAGGGIMNGRGMTAALALGADAAVLGTRFLGAQEANMNDTVRQAILTTSDGGNTTVRSKVFDKVWGSNPWPQLYDGRCLRNQLFNNIEAGMNFTEAQSEFLSLVELSKTQTVDGREVSAIFSGSGVGMVNQIQKAADIMKEIQDNTRTRLEALKAGV